MQSLVEEARRLMQLLRPRVIFSCESAVPTLLKAAQEEHVTIKIVPFGGDSLLQMSDLVITGSEEFVCEHILDPKRTSMILLSSGSSKCVELSAGAVARYLQEARHKHPRRAVCLWYASLYWYCGTMHFLENFVNRNTRILQRNYERDQVCKLVQGFKVILYPEHPRWQKYPKFFWQSCWKYSPFWKNAF